MSILITGIEMPPQGEFKHIRIYENGEVTAQVDTGVGVYEAVIANAIPIPPHGRLIDAKYIDSENDRFFDMSQANEEFDEHASAYAYSLIANILANAPTIIPAEERMDNDDN